MKKPVLKANKLLLIKILLFAAAFYLLISHFSNLAYGRVIYVDRDLTEDCLSGNYSIANRDCSGSEGSAYDIIAEAIAAASAGDTLNIRAGTYTENAIAVGFTGPGMTTIRAYNNEPVTIHNTTVHRGTFELTFDADHITFTELKFTSQRYLLITGWVNHSGNIWKKVFSDRAPGSTDRIINVLFDGQESGNEKQSIGEVVSEYDWYYDKDETILYVYSPLGAPDSYYTDPGVAEGNEYKGIAIGNTSSSPGYIVVDNCEIDSFAHCGLKGGYKWWVKNCYVHEIGTTSRDHGIYLYGEHSSGNEAVLEYNFFENINGSAFQIYHGGYTPRYHIVRYNLVKNADRSGVQLQGAYNLIYNNSFYSTTYGIVLRGTESHDNIVKNNIFDGSPQADISVDHLGYQNKFPTNNTMEYNFYGSNRTCIGCGDLTAVGGDDYTAYSAAPPNIISSNNPFVSAFPVGWEDFRLASDSGCIDTGVKLGSRHANALDSSDTTWPLTTLNQDIHGSGWEIGAFVCADATLQGDVTGDFIINIQDVQLCVNVVLGTETNTDIISRADIDRDGNVDNSDIQRIIDTILTQ